MGPWGGSWWGPTTTTRRRRRPTRSAWAGFWIDRHPVTNAALARLVHNTGHVTVADQAPTRPTTPGPGRSCWSGVDGVSHPGGGRSTWVALPGVDRGAGADWRHPQGPASSINKRPDHPVVQVDGAAVAAEAGGAGKQRPGEARGSWRPGVGWRGHLRRGEVAPSRGRGMATTWQGEFPNQNLEPDGYGGTSPVGRFPANGDGLLDLIGNVGAWTGDWSQAHGELSPCLLHRRQPRRWERGAQPRSPRPGGHPRRVMKGGSHLCAPHYCRRSRPAARLAQPVDTATSHLGFRCILRGH